ncbi:alpha-mannosidase [Paenibacillus filicis]|uniref:Alpha-mannosidase n=1 Tax=Paenibacillus gyeongsangnamensis TaxID=3388067 RepID=A0ABT4Q4N1_9BACL|nr:alpha-mannosidase [Paenibacillus filicis]MCZ8511824.1 alpha-mannosidase [Paenibacillus filicis]
MTNDKTTVHVISHSHWDREWYLPFEQHRARLVQLMDTLIDLLQGESAFQSFHLDGQTIMLDDYLEIRPENSAKIKGLIQQGKLHIGPWYILQDEFLTSGEANLRNLQTGLRMAKAYGSVCRIGYFPDSFGNIGQAPQILRQAGMDCAVFGRGVKATGFNNQTEEAGGQFLSPYSEMRWQSPDGSSVLGILFSNWYHNGMEIPAENEAVRAYWETRIPKAERYASTPHLLFMNGCDHQPVQTNLAEALELARELFPELDFVHSNFEEYIQRVKERLPARLTTITGELRSQRTDGWGTLVNTASARIYMKQRNQTCQALLEKVAEPLAALAARHGRPYPHHLLNYAWKTLMQNHPHDSICGCSIDEVHREMMTRFEKSRQVAELVISDSMTCIAEQINTSGFASDSAKSVPFAVFNSTGWNRTNAVTIELDIKKIRFDGRDSSEIRSELENLFLDKGVLTDAKGERLPFVMEDLGVQFSYELPDNGFRQRFWSRRVQIAFEANDIPAMGYRSYVFHPFESPEDEAAGFGIHLKAREREMENGHIKVTIAGNGSLTLLDKATGVIFKDLCIYEDVGDLGNEYMFKQTEDDALTTARLEADIRLAECSPVRAVFEIVHEWELPAQAHAGHEEDIRRMVPFRKRTGGRSKQKVPFTVITRVTLENNAKSVAISVSFDNQAKDHRLRVLLPTELSSETHFADSIFEIAERSNAPSPEWTNPSNCQHQQAFIDVRGKGAGLAVANRGLPEYEILRDGRNTIALTLLRSVAELGDWGVFPTPEAQCLGNHELHFALIPHGGEAAAYDAYAEAYQFQVPLFAKQTGVHSGPLPGEAGLFRWSGSALGLSALKCSEETNDLIVRWFNMSGGEEQLAFDCPNGTQSVYMSSVLEERAERLPYVSGDELRLSLSPFRIVTLSLNGSHEPGGRHVL